MNGVGDAHAAAMMHQHQQHVQARVHQQQLGVSLPMASSFAPEQASAKPRPPGLPPTPPPAFGGQRPSPGDACMEVDAAAARKANHRRSRSDVPFGYFPPASGGVQVQLPPPKVEVAWGHHPGGGDADDLFNAYLNLEGLDGLNSSDERHDDGDSRGSSIKTNGADSSENESEECAADSRAGIRLWGAEGLKRSAAGEPAGAPMARHARSLSMDSLIGKLNFSAGAAANGAVMPGPNRFSLEFGSGEFTPVEMKKIMADEKLAEMALADPKRVKR